MDEPSELNHCPYCDAVLGKLPSRPVVLDLPDGTTQKGQEFYCPFCEEGLGVVSDPGAYTDS